MLGDLRRDNSPIIFNDLMTMVGYFMFCWSQLEQALNNEIGQLRTRLGKGGGPVRGSFQERLVEWTGLVGHSQTDSHNRLKIWRVLLKHAIGLDQIEINPARDIERHKTQGEGFHCWTDEEIAQYRARHASGTKARLAFEIALWAGARRGDLVRLGRQHVSNGSLSYISEKTRIEVCIPVLPEAQTEIGQVPRAQMLFLMTAHGKPHSAKAFGAWFGKRCREAGLPNHCSLHGLRKARARRMAEAGATTHAIAAWGGWKTLAEVAHYTDAVDRRKLTHAGTEQKQNFDNPANPVVENREKPN